MCGWLVVICFGLVKPREGIPPPPLVSFKCDCTLLCVFFLGAYFFSQGVLFRQDLALKGSTWHSMRKPTLLFSRASLRTLRMAHLHFSSRTPRVRTQSTLKIFKDLMSTRTGQLRHSEPFKGIHSKSHIDAKAVFGSVAM